MAILQETMPVFLFDKPMHEVSTVHCTVLLHLPLKGLLHALQLLLIAMEVAAAMPHSCYIMPFRHLSHAMQLLLFVARHTVATICYY